MTWIKSHLDLRSHPKGRKLARLLGISHAAAVGHLHFLWYWAVQFADSGDLSGFDELDIVEAAGWEGEPETFIEALLECGGPGQAGFLERQAAGQLVIHDWMDYAGRLVERRRKDADRKRAKRTLSAGLPGDSHETSAGQPADRGSRTDKPHNVRGTSGPTRAKTQTQTETQSRVNTSDAHASSVAPLAPARAVSEVKQQRVPPHADVFDAILVALGIASVDQLTRSARGAINKAVKEIVEAGGVAAEVPTRAANYRARYPNMPLTATALAKH
ncbi:MAG: hypothetical protein CL878_14765 [Dehalococcoidia bacterium]|nr:hypothetical protein [Dehalococcoidia bacterium]